MGATLKDEFAAAVVTKLQAGQMLAVVQLRQPYAAMGELVMVDVQALSPYARHALLSADSSAKIPRTSEVEGWLSRVWAMAFAVAKRSKAPMANSISDGVCVCACISCSRKSNGSGVVASGMFPPVVEVHGKRAAA